MKPDKENILLWVEALESGEFPQGRSYLHTLPLSPQGEGYCCLGVACEVARRNGVTLQVNEELDFGCITYDGLRGTLPDPVQRWLGIMHPNPQIKNLPASYLNDTEKLSLAEIADRIRDQWLREET